MKTCNPKYESYVPDLIRRATGSLPVRLIPVPTVPDTIVYEAELPIGSVVFKAIDAQGRDPDGIALEAWMCETVRALGVPAPRILTVDISRSALPASYFIMEKASGQPLNSLPAAQQRPFLRRIGAHLRRMHSVQIERFGWLDEQHYRQHGVVRGSDPTWRDAVLKDVAASLAYFQHTGALEPRFVLNIERIVEFADPLLRTITLGQLLHGDIGELHVWVDPNRGDVTSFVDFGQRSAGDPIWDMMQFDWAGVPLVAEGYEFDPPARERFRPTFHLYTVLQAIPWARKWHARGGVHTVDWLKTTIREAIPILGL
jgi:aminoglycoside phosphotransferase (APT) family kinase protein